MSKHSSSWIKFFQNGGVVSDVELACLVQESGLEYKQPADSVIVLTPNS